MIRFLHTADLHLGASFPGLGPFGDQRAGDFTRTFRRLVDLAIQREVDLFLVAGDLFDTPDPERALVGLVEGELQRLVQRGILPVLLPGTHDPVLAGSRVYGEGRFPGCVQFLESGEPLELKVRENRVFLYACPWSGREKVDLAGCMARRQTAGLHIGLLHGSLEGNPDWNYRSIDMPFTFPALKQWQLDYVALGHYHGFQRLEDSSRLWGCYCGSPEGKRFGENGERYVVIGELDGAGPRIETVAVQSRCLHEAQLEVEARSDNAEIASRLAAMGGEGLVARIRLSGVLDRALDLDYLHSYAAPRFDYLELVDRTRWLQGDDLEALAAEETVRGTCVKRFQQLLAETREDEAREEVEQALREVMVRFQGQGRSA